MVTVENLLQILTVYLEFLEQNLCIQQNLWFNRNNKLINDHGDGRYNNTLDEQTASNNETNNHNDDDQSWVDDNDALI